MDCKFLHLGDLHLDQPMGMFSADAAKKRRRRHMEALERVLREGVERGAQFVLLAGDCFDTVSPPPELYGRFLAALKGAGVPVVIAPGNHDYYTDGGFWNYQPLPENVYLFTKPTLDRFDLPAFGVSVYGYAFTAETMAAPDLRPLEPPAGTAILLAHGDALTPLSAYAPLTTGHFEGTPYVYAALGHIHKPTAPWRCGKTLVAYCGFLAGHGFDELGPGGGSLVTVTGDRTEIEKVYAGADEFRVEELDCTGAADAEDIRARVADYLKEHPVAPETALRLRLTGSVGLDCKPDVRLLQLLGEHLALFEVADETLPLYDAAYLEKDPTLTGAFYRALLPRFHSADPAERAAAAEALRLGIAALQGRRV